MAEISSEARRELVVAVSARYRDSSKNEKTLILDEFVSVTGFHRNHATRLLKAGGASAEQKPRRQHTRVYDEAVAQSLIVLWEASDRICGCCEPVYSRRHQPRSLRTPRWRAPTRAEERVTQRGRRSKAPQGEGFGPAASSQLFSQIV